MRVRSGSVGFFTDQYASLLLFFAAAINEVNHQLYAFQLDVGRISINQMMFVAQDN